jgi:4-nitrophenyl phosphatase
MPELDDLRRIAGFIFDMDGVIYRGAAAIPGAGSFVARLRAASVPFLFLTNNATTPADQVAARITGMGIPASSAEIVTSADAAAATLAAEQPGGRALVIGEAGLTQALTAAGLSLVSAHHEADVVVAGLDRDVTYTKLREAALAIQRGVPFIATNTDASLPTEAGPIPGAGALVGALQIATGVAPRVIGKPMPGFFEFGLRRLGVPRERTATIGDRPDTDIAGGQAAGLRTIAVLTGIGTAEQFAAMRPPPDWVFADLNELARAYFEEH